MKHFKKKGFWVLYVSIVLAGTFIIVALGLQNQSPGIPDVNAQSTGSFGMAGSSGAMGYGSFPSYIFTNPSTPTAYNMPQDIIFPVPTTPGTDGETKMRTIMTCSGCSQTMSTCDWQCGATFMYCTPRVGQGSTMSTCSSGILCGTTMSTCGSGMLCGSTMSTCSSGILCGGSTMSTCSSGILCGGSTMSTCSSSILCGGSTMSTCSSSLFGSCGSTILTCSSSLFGGCGGGGNTLGICSLPTSSTCTGCSIIGETGSTCAYLSCGVTGSTCGYLSCGGTYSTCGWECTGPFLLSEYSQSAAF